jgi:hypothetical protein
MELDFNNVNPLVATVARLFASEGKAKEVATLAHSIPKVLTTRYENPCGDIYHFDLSLQVPYRLFSQLETELEDLQESIATKMQLVL